MMSIDIHAIGRRFDDLAAKAESPDIKLLIEAIKLQTEMMNVRLAAIERTGTAQMR
jgi:hypothetical protein